MRLPSRWDIDPRHNRCKKSRPFGVCSFSYPYVQRRCAPGHGRSSGSRERKQAERYDFGDAEQRRRTAGTSENDIPGRGSRRLRTERDNRKRHRKRQKTADGNGRAHRHPAILERKQRREHRTGAAYGPQKGSSGWSIAALKVSRWWGVRPCSRIARRCSRVG